MSGEHAEIALDTGNIDLIHFTGEGEFFGRNEIEMEGGHGEPASGEWRIASSEECARIPYLFVIPYSPFVRLSRFGSQLLALFDRLFDGADHVERGFRQMIVLAFADGAETLDGVGEVDELAGRSREDFSDEERLRQEALNLARPGDGDLVLFG